MSIQPKCVRRTSAVVLLIVIAGAGCAAEPIKPVELREKVEVELVDGRTTREQVLLKFGEPSAQFEGGRIFTYRVDVHDDGTWHVVGRRLVAPKAQHWDSTWEQTRFSVVLVFEGSVLRRHSLVEVK